MKKVVKIVLVVVLALYAAFTTATLFVAAKEQIALEEKYDDLKEKSDALAKSWEEIQPGYQEYLEQKRQDILDSVDMLAIQSWANCVSEKNYVCKVDSETVMAVVYAEGRTKDEFLEDISGFGSVLTAALKTGEYSKGIIVFMDDNNTVWAGATVAADGGSWPFITDSWVN